MNTPDHPGPPDQPDAADPAFEASERDPSHEAPDETLADMNGHGESDLTGKTTADFGPGWKDNLVAYLDGELNEEDMQELDQVLVRHPDARVDVEELRQTWDLLDVLPRPAVTEEFSAQTLATMQVYRDEEPAPPSPWPRRGLMSLVWALLLSVSGIAGVLLADRWQPDPTDKLIVQLSVVERLEAYREIGDLQFIKALADTGRFPRNDELAEPTTKNSILLEAIPENPQERRQYISDLPLDRRKRLTKNSADFQVMGPAKQQELNQLDVEITRSTALTAAAADFYAWLKTLQPWQRDEIHKTTTGASEKITLILEYLDEQEQQQTVRSLGGPQAAAALGQGPSLNSEEFARAIVAIERSLSPMQKQQLANRADLRGTARAMVILELSVGTNMNLGRPGPGPRPPRPQERGRVSWPDPELSQAIITSIDSEAVLNWVSESDGPASRRARLGLVIIRSLVLESFREIRRNRLSDRDLQEYFVGLSRERQDELMRLPPSESKRQLRRSLYQENNPTAIGSPLQLYARYFRLLGRIRPRRGGEGGGSRKGAGPGRPPATRPPGGTR